MLLTFPADMFSSRSAPYAPAADTLDIPGDDKAIRKIELPKTYVEKSTQRVLLLDDDQAFREVIEEYLVSRLYRVTAVSNGVEGLREIMKDPFDVIICDMMMPKLNGEMFYWATTRIRPAAGQRFIFITGYQNDPKIEAFFRRVSATSITKPFQVEALNTAIVDVLTRLR